MASEDGPDPLLDAIVCQARIQEHTGETFRVPPPDQTRMSDLYVWQRIAAVLEGETVEDRRQGTLEMPFDEPVEADVAGRSEIRFVRALTLRTATQVVAPKSRSRRG